MASKEETIELVETILRGHVVPEVVKLATEKVVDEVYAQVEDIARQTAKREATLETRDEIARLVGQKFRVEVVKT